VLLSHRGRGTHGCSVTPSHPFSSINGASFFYEFARFDLGCKSVEQLLDRNAPGARAAGIARTDDETTQALETAKQLVLLGAGFDTRAYRLLSAQRVISFELDYPETLRAKQAVLHQEIGRLSKQAAGSLPPACRSRPAKCPRHRAGQARDGG